jgi:hypothetical protein
VLPFVAPYLLNGIVLVVTALVVFSFKPQLPAARAFLALGLTFGLLLLALVVARLRARIIFSVRDFAQLSLLCIWFAVILYSH